MYFNKIDSQLTACHAKSLQSYPTLCDSMGCSLPGSSVHGIFQARILEWAAISFSPDSVGELKKKKATPQSYTTPVKSESLEMRPRYYLKRSFDSDLQPAWEKHRVTIHSLFFKLFLSSFVIPLTSFSVIPFQMISVRNVSGKPETENPCSS